ncbi:MAG: hypothetical protein JO026_01520 [Patescibacteria group bacterium]|nr:hypothetical protein [Patescibacteria group bacterium]
MVEKTNMFGQAVRGISITAFGNILLNALSVLSTLLILHNLVPYDYGLWRLLLSAMTAVGLLGLTGVTGMFTADIVRELGEERPENARFLLSRVTRFFLFTCLIAALALCIAAPIISRLSGIALTLYLYVLSLTVLATGLRQPYQIYFQAYLHPFAAQLLKNATTILYLLGIGLFVAFLNWGLWGLVAAYTLSQLIPVVMYAPSFFHVLKPRTMGARPTYNFSRAFFGRGKWALAEDYVAALTNALWPWITGYFLSISEVGIISLALLLMSQVSALVPFQYVYRSLLPRMTQERERVGEWLMRGMRYSVFAQVAIGACAWFAIALLIPWIAAKYSPVIPLFGFLFIALPVNGIGIMLTEWFYAHKRQREFFIASALPSIGLMILLPFLLLSFGLAGFVLWYILNSAATDAFSLWYARRDPVFPLKISLRILPDRKDFALIREAVSTFRAR